MIMDSPGPEDIWQKRDKHDSIANDDNRPYQDGFDRAIRWLADKQLIIISCFAVLVLVFGYWGFQVLAGGGLFSPFNSASMYRSLQLFVLESGLVPDPPLPLEFARFFAPVIAAYAIILLFVKIFWENVQEIILKCRRIKPQVIICGLGYLGPLYVRRFRNRGYLPVIIEKDPDNPMNTSYGPFNPMIIVGDATDPKVLKRANIQKSRGLIIVTGDDKTNIQILMSARNLLKSRDHDKNTRLLSLPHLVHIEDRWLGKALSKRGVKYPHFNMYEIAARDLVSWVWKHSIEKDTWDGKNPHFLIVGIGTMGEEFSRELIRKWSERSQKDDSRLLLSFIDFKDAQDKKARLDLWVRERKQLSPDSSSFDSVQISEYGFKIPSAAFLEGKYLAVDGKDPVISVVICLADETLAITTALELDHILKNPPDPSEKQRNIPIFVRTTREDGTLEFIKSLNTNATEQLENIRPFSIVEFGSCWTREMETRFPVQHTMLGRILKIRRR